MSGIESWSTNPANNNQSPPFGWPAGMLPSQVEPTARQDMASIRTWYESAEWINFGDTPTFGSSTTFTVPGNLTARYHVGRRVQMTNGSTTTYGTITASAFTTLTTVTVSVDAAGSVPSAITTVWVGITSAINTSLPPLAASAFTNPSASIGLTAVNGSATTAMRSDAAPALSQAISPTWTGNHTFSNAIAVNGAGSSLKGGVTVTAPGSGVAVTSNAVAGSKAFLGIGAAGDFAAALSNVNTAGSSFGLLIQAGTNAADYALRIQNASASSDLFTVVGSGNVTINAPSSGVALQVQGVAGSAAAVAQFTTNSIVGGGFVQLQDTANGATRGYWGHGSSILSAAAISDIVVRSEGGMYLATNGNNSRVYVTPAGVLQAIDDGGTMQTVGWRGTPLNTQSGNYTLAVSDRGKTVQSGVNATYTVPSGVFSNGDVVTLRVVAGATLTIAGSGVTLSWAGNGSTTGNRTLTGEGIATLLFTGSNTATISGAGLS